MDGANIATNQAEGGRENFRLLRRLSANSVVLEVLLLVSPPPPQLEEITRLPTCLPVSPQSSQRIGIGGEAKI